VKGSWSYFTVKRTPSATGPSWGLGFLGR